jgi:phosphatidylglycerol:prolipoprotein diacylglycerol transferase
MYPILAHIDALGGPIRSYPSVLVLAVVVGILVAVPRLRRVPGVDRRLLVALVVWGALGGWLGGRVHQLVNLGQYAWQRIVVEGRIHELFGNSFHAGGAVLGLVVAVAIVTRRRGVGLGSVGDAIVPAFGLSLALGRFACFLHGCCTGTTCEHAWCMAYPKPTHVWNYHVYLRLVPHDGDWSAPVHPLPLYFTAVGVIIAAVGWGLDRRKRYDGESALVALLIFSASNVLLEGFRGFAPMRRFWGGVPALTWVALATMLATLVVFLACELRHRRRLRSLREVAA